MPEKLIVENFLTLKKVEFKFNSINIIIGPQATGKSVLLKLVYYFKTFFSHVVSSAEDGLSKRSIDSQWRRKYEEYFPPSSWGKSPFKVRYEADDLFIQIERPDAAKFKILLTYSEYIKKSIRYYKYQLKKELKEDIYKEISLEKYRLLQNARRSLREKLGLYYCGYLWSDQTFIPAGRSFYAALTRSTFTYLSNNDQIDPFLKQFGHIYELYRHRFYGSEPVDPSLYKYVQRKFEKIIGGRYRMYKDKEFLETDDGRTIKISNSSSGQQESLPLLKMISSLAAEVPNFMSQNLYIEEPEAHLFPMAQRHVIELLAALFNGSQGALQLFITTHSPYIITATNNLLQAGILRNMSNKIINEKLTKIISERVVVEPHLISAYSLSKKGLEDVMCKETGLIDTEIIDEVSNDLSIQFDELIDLEQ